MDLMLDTAASCTVLDGEMAHADAIPARRDGSGSASPIFAAPVRPLLRVATLAAFLFLAATSVVAQEIVFGGEAFFAAGITGDRTNPGAISPFSRIGLDPDLTIFADTAELRASGSIPRDSPGWTLRGDSSSSMAWKST